MMGETADFKNNLNLLWFGGWIRPKSASTKPLILSLEPAGDDKTRPAFAIFQGNSLVDSMSFPIEDGM
jgi:hypothetical protein